MLFSDINKFKKIYVEISNICNLQCTFCPEVLRSKQIMSLESFEQIVNKIAPITEEVCLHLMGEPLTHPKLNQLIQICSKYNLPINLTTNGTLIHKQKYDWLFNPIIRQINISLHSFKNNFPDKPLSDYLNPIFKFTHKAFELRPDLYINYRLWLSPAEDSHHTHNEELLKEIELTFNVQINRTIHLDWHKSKKIINRLYLNFDTEFEWPNPTNNKLGTQGTCYGLRNHLGILTDGTVVPCCLDKEGHINLGNIHQKNISDIINDPRSKRIKKGFESGQLVEDLCQKCSFIRRFG